MNGPDLMMDGQAIQIIAVLTILLLVLVAFIRDWASPDILAMSALCVLVLSGLLPMDTAFQVFSNDAPITIAAMFILSAGLEKTGVIDWIGHGLNRIVSRQLWLTFPALMILVAFCSAFVNNTPVVAILMPVLLTMCRKKNIAASKVLIPLSYAAVLGGCCTLIGTSTNIVVNNVASEQGMMPPLGMFEFSGLGLILLGVGIVYVTVLGPSLLPDRQSISSVLAPSERRQFLCHLLVKPGSILVGQRLTESPLGNSVTSFRIIEVRRGGARLTLPLNQVVVSAYDRVMVAVSSKNMSTETAGSETLLPEVAERLGIENLSTIKGAVIEGIIAPHSRLIGKSLRSARFRQTYGMLVLAVHRRGLNLEHGFQDAELQFGDTVLMLGPLSTFSQMREAGDFTLLEDHGPERGNIKQAWIVVASLAGVVTFSALNWVPIALAALIACVVVLWARCLNPREAYESIDWTVLFMLYGMLAIGEALRVCGAPNLIAESVVTISQNMVPAAWLPLFVLALFYLIGNVLTEVLSNTATAVILTPIALGFATSLNLDPRPFVIAVAFSSSLAFTTPIGYQTHMMVYGAGGYRFSDFVRFGLPLNLIVWIVATYYIWKIWGFKTLP